MNGLMMDYPLTLAHILSAPRKSMRARKSWVKQYWRLDAPLYVS